MTNLLWALIAVVSLTGCISKAKYNEQRGEIEKVYTRIDHMTNAMNQMGAEITRLEETLSEHKNENEIVISKLRIEELELTDVQAELEIIGAAMKSYTAHHEAGDALVAHFAKLKASAEPALQHGHIKFLAEKNEIGFIIETAVFAPANSPKLDTDLSPSIQALSKPINDFNSTQFQVVAHVDETMPTGKQFDSVYELGLARSIRITEELIDAGVSPSKLSTSVMVAPRPVAPEATKEQREWARRIEIRVVRDLKGNPANETFEQIESGKLHL